MTAVAAKAQKAHQAQTGRVVDQGLAALNALDQTRAAKELAACCASSRWVAALTAGRPFGTVAELYSAAAVVLTMMDWPDVLEALAAHPRIGSPATGTDPEAAWSRLEQAGAQGATVSTAEALAAANAAYEDRFGHVFLIRAAGRSAEEMLASALDRLGHDEPTEQPVVRAELAQIVRLRLDRMLDGLRQRADA
ncbi:MAG: 2-oxo-4-hydroxy-4-carboxy-5-ureidoimidazoline decarboxylase [Catenulisporales bacterium]|jgi:2-oxo-4-hydroxy-4-carboxy-5-ureidoimidazoline decarboxylase|nr:2-oxo-4-hydroxy-4-carboxy-5-ureidoimidazoline decarboxylase [Catenulisporales bacterium]